MPFISGRSESGVRLRKSIRTGKLCLLKLKLAIENIM